MVGGLLHDLKLHLSECFCSYWFIMPNKLQKSITRLYTVQITETRFDHVCYETKRKSATNLDYGAVHLVSDETELAAGRPRHQ